MAIDARNIGNGTSIVADVCIVGAGTAGLSLAREFVGQSFDVCLLESGGLKADRQTQSLYEGKNIGHPHPPIHTVRARYFGGSTNRWHIPVGEDCSRARMRPLDQIDFEYRDWVPYSGWPFDKAHLDPYYDRAQEVCRIAPPSYKVMDWADPVETPPIKFSGNRTQTVLFKFGSRYPFIKDYAEQIFEATNFSTYLYANVTDIEMAENGQSVERLRVATLDGKTHWVSAKIFILATGAIEIPRLMLASINRCRNGIGNQNDLVGRFFMEHPHFWLGFYLPAGTDIFHSMALYARIHEVNNVAVTGKISPTEAVLRQERLLNHNIEFIPRVSLETFFDRFFYPRIESKSVESFLTTAAALRKAHLPSDFGGHLSNMARGFDDIAISAFRVVKKKARKTMVKKRAHYFILAHMCEQSPNPNSRVVLGHDRDSLGLLRANLDWQLSSIDLESARRSQEILDEELRRDNLGQLLFELDDDTPPEKIKYGMHHMGTTRMHVDPKQGVVDENCRVHGIENLFIAGPSVFPTGGYANPSLTIVALSLRLADHIKTNYDKIAA